MFLPLPLFPPPLSFFTLIFALHPAVFLLRKCLLKNGHPQRANLTPRNPQDPFTLFLESRFLEGLVTSVQFYKHPSLPISQREIINKMSTVCELIDVFVVASVSVLRSHPLVGYVERRQRSIMKRQFVISLHVRIFQTLFFLYISYTFFF